MKLRLAFAAAALMAAALVAATATAAPKQRVTQLMMLASGVDVRLRGVSAVNDSIAWASGGKGTVLRTVDGGQGWQRLVVPDAEALDFRDIEAFDANTALVMAAGPGVQSRVFRTSDAGQTWQQVLDTSEPKAFFDCMAFDGARGWLLGDPIGDRFQLYVTSDAGQHWTLDPNGPPAGEGEAAFAASGTCIARLRGATAVVSGGSASRLHLLRDGSKHWQTLDTGMARGKPAAGAFSVAALGAGAMVVGGEYTAEQSPGNAASIKQLRASAMRIDPAPRGYRSGIACDARRCIAVGPSGVELWNGRSWTMLSEASFDAVAMRGNVAWLSGAKGALARIDLGR